MKSPHAVRYNGLMENATTNGGLPYLRFGKGEPLVAPHSLYEQPRHTFDRVTLDFLAS
jgi:hypothetical protein